MPWTLSSIIISVAEEAKEVLQELDRRVSIIASFVKDALTKGGKLELLGAAYLRFETDEGHAFIYSSCFPDLAFEDESMNHIRAIEDDLIALTNR